MTINTFIFDCFGVICGKVLIRWYEENRLKHGLVDPNLSTIFGQLDLGIISDVDIINYFSKYKDSTKTKEEIQKEVDSYIVLNEPLVSIIKQLKQNGFKIVLLSNGNNSFLEKKIYTKYPELKNLFDDTIISSVIGMVKPNPDIYLYTLKRINSKAEETLFIDDSAHNIDTAINLGMHGYIYENTDSFVKYLTSIKIPLA